MKISKKESTIDAVKEDFVKTNEALSLISSQELLTIYLKTYLDAFKVQAILRAKFLPTMMKEFGLGVEDFLNSFNKVLLNYTKEDLPFLKNTTGWILFGMTKEFGLKLSQIEYQFSGDEFTKEDQSWWYRDTLDELEKIVNSEDGGNPDTLEMIKASKEEAKKFK